MTSIKRHLITASLVAGAVAAPALVLADGTASPTPTPWYQKVTVGGYIDEYYQHSFNYDNTNNTVSNRVFDTQSNQFTFGGGELTLKQNDAASGTGYFVDLMFGPEASIFNNSGSVDSFQVGQAYVTQAFGNATFTLGRFATPVGYEVAYAPSNANFSRSLLYSNEPFFNTGLRLDYALTSTLTLSGFTDDGNSVDNAASIGKDYGAILAYTGVKNLSLTGLWYLNNTNEYNDGTTNHLYDTEWANFIATYTASDSLNFAGEYLIKQYALDDKSVGIFPYDPIQQGYAVYASYSPMANWTLSPRWEQWFNPNSGIISTFNGLTSAADQITANGNAVQNDLTVTLKYQMGPLAHLLEYRADSTNVDTYTTLGSNKITSPNTFLTKIQQTLTYAAEYSF